MGLVTRWTFDRIHLLDWGRVERLRVHGVPRINHLTRIRALDENPVQPILAVLEPIARMQGEFRNGIAVTAGSKATPTTCWNATAFNRPTPRAY